MSGLVLSLMRSMQNGHKQQEQVLSAKLQSALVMSTSVSCEPYDR